MTVLGYNKWNRLTFEIDIIIRKLKHERLVRSITEKF